MLFDRNPEARSALFWTLLVIGLVVIAAPLLSGLIHDWQSPKSGVLAGINEAIDYTILVLKFWLFGIPMVAAAYAMHKRLI